MTKNQKIPLITAWNWCDHEDKSTEFMLSYMSDMAKIDYSDVVDFVCGHTRTEEELKY